MVRHKCQACANSVSIQLFRVSKRTCVECRTYCREHGLSFVAEHYSPHASVAAGPSAASEVSCDVELYYSDLTNGGAGYVGLAEVGGERRLRVLAEPHELRGLDLALRSPNQARPATHQAMMNVIKALGGRLEGVHVDRILPADRRVHAEIDILMRARRLLLAAYGCDALVLAMLAEAPIFVSSQVLASVEEGGQSVAGHRAAGGREGGNTPDNACFVQGCAKPVQVEFYRLEGRKHAEVKYLCRAHGDRILAMYRGETAVTINSPPLPDDLRFDLAWHCRERSENGTVVCHVCLEEENGPRRCMMQIGPHELQSLHDAAQSAMSLSYLPYFTMGAIIEGMGGHLERVVINQFDADGNVYHAKLVVACEERDVVVDIRPSDALILAILRDVPIFVGPKVPVSATAP